MKNKIEIRIEGNDSTVEEALARARNVNGNPIKLTVTFVFDGYIDYHAAMNVVKSSRKSCKPVLLKRA